MHITKKKRDAIVKLHRQGESIELLTAISRSQPNHHYIHYQKR